MNEDSEWNLNRTVEPTDESDTNATFEKDEEQSVDACAENVSKKVDKGGIASGSGVSQMSIKSHSMTDDKYGRASGGLMKQLKGLRKKMHGMVVRGATTISAPQSPKHDYNFEGGSRILPRQNGVRYMGAYSKNAFVCESAQFIFGTLREVQANSPYSMALIGLSGGSTPKKVLETLASLSAAVESGPSYHRQLTQTQLLPSGNSEHPHVEVPLSLNMEKVDWTRVIIFLVDERYVPADHPDSNQRMIKEALCGPGKISIPEHNLIFPNTELPINMCVSDYAARLKHILSYTGRPHLITLGFGEDGHTASWFPPLTEEDCQRAHAKDQLVSHTIQNRYPVTDRITISLDLICSCPVKLFMLADESKNKKWKELISERSPEAYKQEPVLQILESRGVSVVSLPPIEQDVLSNYHDDSHLTIIVFGASGDLAKKKTIPALFSLFCEGLLPVSFHIVGYARTRMTDDEFWARVEPNVQKLEPFFRGATGYQEALAKDPNLNFLETFKNRIQYMSGSYNNEEDFLRLKQIIDELETSQFSKNDRMFYLAVPPEVFAECVHHSKNCCWSQSGWNRFVVEKPFGRDLSSAMNLAKTMLKNIKEEETYRIDHYLGKEMVLNLTVIRFANAAFAPLMSWQHVAAVRITFKETIGTEGRGGYFDQHGIIRDIMQNHLLQVLTIVAMERPVSLRDDDIRDEKVKVLKAIAPANLRDTIIGQYTKALNGSMPGYLDDETVQANSRCSTFCTTVLYVNNERWAKVPFILKAGKALEEKVMDIRIQFRPVPGNLFGSHTPQNELVVKVQPSEAIYMKVLTKKPGLTQNLIQTELNLSVMDRFDVDRLPDAYERLLLDVLRGDKQNFVRTDELREAWRIFTPLLNELEDKRIQPLLYPAGSRGPEESDDLIRNSGYLRFEGYRWN